MRNVVDPSITLSRHVLVLALDTTSRSGSAAVVQDGELVGEIVGDGSRTHGERLPLDLMRVLETASVRLDAVDLLAVAAGPGSFTGLRVGIAAMQGLAMAIDRRIVPISALEALAIAGADGDRARGAVDRRAARRSVRVAVRCHRHARRAGSVVAPADSDARGVGRCALRCEPSGSSATAPHDTRRLSASGSVSALESCRRRPRRHRRQACGRRAGACGAAARCRADLRSQAGCRACPVPAGR